MRRLLAIFCLIPSILLSQAAPRSDSDPRIKTLDGRAADAKAKGLTEVIFLAPEQIPAFSRGLVDASSRFSVMVGRLIATQALVNKQYILAWYTLAIDSVLTEHPSPFYTFNLNNFPANERPTSLLPVGSNHLLLIQPGGKVTIQGISVIERENGGRPLELNQPYLFIVETSLDHQLARLPFGSAGVFEIQADGDSLRPMTSLSHEIPDDVRSLCSNSLSLIRRKLSDR